MPFGIGAPELLIILAIVVVLFGATRLTDIGKNLGKGIKEFRRELKDDEPEKKDEATVASKSSSEEKPTGTQAH
jgi:sec-independent protein translocase protein TatA